MNLIRTILLWFPLVLPAYVIRFQLGPLPTTALELCFWILAVGATVIAGPGVWREGLRRTKPWHGALLLWILATLLAIAVAPNHVAAFGLWRAYVLEPILFFILLSSVLRTDDDRRELIRSLIAVSCALALVAILQFLTNQGIPSPWNTIIEKRRATGPFPFPNALSLFCAPIAALCIGLITSNAIRFSKTELWMGFISASVATILAKSVGGMLAILVATLLALLWNRRTQLATIGVSILALLAIALTPALRTPIIHTLTFNEWSGKVRLIVWKETTTMLKDTSTELGAGRPIFGAGLGAYPDVIRPYHKATFIEIFQYPHNILLNLWSETGLFGVIAFGWIVVVWMRRSKALSSDTRAPNIEHQIFLLPLIAILMHGLVDVPYFKNDLAILFWIFAALATVDDPARERQTMRLTHSTDL